MLLDGDVGVLSKEQQEYLNTMQSVTYNLADLVSMILDVSRIQLGKMKVDLQSLDLNTFFKEILTVIQPKAKEKNQDFQVTIPENLPTALLDKRLTRMTVENLLSNAVKYTPEKGSVTWHMEQRGDVLYMEVKDTGCGIPEKDQKNIFGKLYRASNTGSIDGNGFGLYVAKGAIEAQGGKIWFESKENKGTTFFVEMPIKKPVPESSGPAR
jgi:signal transduction histidine kinase